MSRPANTSSKEKVLLSNAGNFISVSAGPMQNVPKPPTFASKEQERGWIKFRLAQGNPLLFSRRFTEIVGWLACRIFAHHGFDDGIAGLITARVSDL